MKTISNPERFECDGRLDPPAAVCLWKARGRRIVTVILAGLVPLLESTSSSATNYSDLWWNPAESGWGLSLTDHETQLFGVWFTYRADGGPTWFVVPGGTFSEGRRLFAGDLYKTSGPAYNTIFNSGLVQTVKVGSVRLDFAPSGLEPGIALFTSTVGSVTQTRQVQRQSFGNAPPDWGTDYTDIWWDPAESGWGLTLAQHGNNVFGVWFTYGTDGQPLFVVLPSVEFATPGAFAGALYTTTGPYYGEPSFDASRVRVTAVGNASIAFNGRNGTFTSTVNGHTQVKTLVQQSFGLATPSGAPIGAHLLSSRGVWAGFDRRGWPNGYNTGDLIQRFNQPDTELQQAIGASSASATIRDEVALQLDQMRAMGVNVISFEMRATDPTWIPGPFLPPTCNLGPALGLLYPQPAAQDLANLVAFLDLAQSKGMRVFLILDNTHMEENPPENNARWLGAILDAVGRHEALDLITFGGDERIQTWGDGTTRCGSPSEAPLWMGPSSYAGNYVKWAIKLGMDKGVPARKLTAEAVVGNYFTDVVQGPAGSAATNGHFWNPAVALKRIFDDLAIPEAERTYALSLYFHRKCLNFNNLPGACSEADAHAWADETLATVRGIVGNTSRVVAAEFGLFEPQSADWPTPEHAFESLTALMARHGVEGGSWWTWTEVDEAMNAVRPGHAIKKRGLAFEYNRVQRDLAAAYGFRLSVVPNGSFENGAALADGWTVSGNGSASRFRLAGEPGQPEVPTRGSYALRLVAGPGSTDAVSVSSEAIPVSPNTAYTTTANLQFRWVGDATSGDRASRPHVYAAIRYYAVGGVPSAIRAEDTIRYYQENATSGFETFPLAYTTPSDARSVRIVYGAARNGLAQPLTIELDYVR